MTTPLCAHCAVPMMNPRPWPDLHGTLFDCPECGTSLLQDLDPAEVQESILIAAMEQSIMLGTVRADIGDLLLGWKGVEKAYLMEGDRAAAERCAANVAMLEFFAGGQDMTVAA